MPEIRRCTAGHEYWFPRESWKHEGCVPNEEVPNKSVANVPNSKSMDYLRVKLWKEANRDRYNASQRELMRKRRAKNKGAVNGKE